MSLAENLFSRIVVVLPQSEEGQYDVQSELISRAIALADRFESELFLLQTLGVSSAMQNLYRADPEGARLIMDLTELERDRMARLVASIVSNNPKLRVQSEILDERPRSEAIVEFATGCVATLIMKESREKKFFLGLLSNTDWDLLRDAPTPVWLVAGRSDPRNGIVTAVELEEHDGDIAIDQRVFSVARSLSEKLESPLYTVHSYEVPSAPGFNGYTPLYAGDMLDPSTMDTLQEAEAKQRERLGRKHGQSLTEFLNNQNMVLDDVVVKEGYAPDVIKEEAERHQAGLIVMGASRDKGRWERLTRNVTAEVALEDAPCDLLFVH